MIRLSNMSKLSCYCTINTTKYQRIEIYKLSNGLNMAFGSNSSDPNGITIKVGTANLSAKVGTTVAKNGMQYTLSLVNNQFNLSIELVNGSMLKASADKTALAGTVKSDIFYGGKTSDTIAGKDGRDVAVYDKSAWDTDVIKKTSGTMTLLFKDFKESDNALATKLSGTTMTITRLSNGKAVKNQSITVQGWDSATHNIVFGGTMKAFDSWLTAAKPSTVQTAARNEVWKKAGLATA